MTRKPEESRMSAERRPAMIFGGNAALLVRGKTNSCLRASVI